MRFSNFRRFVLTAGAIGSLLTLCACGGGSSSPSSSDSQNSCPAANTSCTSASGPTAIPTSTSTSLPLYIADSSTTGEWGYTNEPLVSVTVCTPNHTSSSQCQTISNVLLDTGSFGLRVFGSAITNANTQLVQQTISVQGKNLNLAECAEFGTGADWGAVMNGDVKLGSQTATNIPIQVININFGAIPSGCAALCPDTDPCTAGYNGILGVGLFAQDCGDLCADYNDDSDNPGIYFGCDSSGCYDATHGNCGSDGVCVFEVPASQQVLNPVASFASGHNNGISLTLPNVSSSGSSAITGSVGLGIGSPNSVTVYDADPSGMTDGAGSDFVTVFQGTTYGDGTDTSISFLDSGSNGLFFPWSAAQCPDDPGFYCPSSTQALSATIEDYYGSPSVDDNFSVGNAENLFNTGNFAFNNIGGQATSMFDWGLPFFYGRTVYVGLDGTNATIDSSSVTGPYWAF